MEDPLQLKGLTKIYGGGQLALDKVTAAIGFGVHGLLGENGAGKTTLLSILATLTPPTAGTATIFGLDVARHKTEIRRQLGLVPQDVGLYHHLNCIEFLDYVAHLKEIRDGTKRRRNIEQALEEVNLTAHASHKVAELSGGMKRRLGIAQALLSRPQILIVDEPTAGLDPIERMRLRLLLQRLSAGRVILFSTHIVEDISSCCEGVLILRKGSCLYNGSITALIRRMRGQVWTATIDPDQFVMIAERYRIVSCVRMENQLQIRFLSVEEELPDGAQPVEPTLEDAYLIINMSSIL